MQKLGAVLRAYTQRKKAAPQPSAIDAGTVLHVAGAWIAREYGRRGVAMMVPVRYESGTLTIAVADSLWAQELWMRRKAFRHAINTQCRTDAVRRIKTVAREV